MRATTLVGRLIGVEEAVVEGFDIVDDQAKGRLVLTARVRPYRRSKPRCSRCGVRCPGYDQGGGPRRWRALDLGEIVVYLAATMFRVSVPSTVWSWRKWGGRIPAPGSPPRSRTASRG